MLSDDGVSGLHREEPVCDSSFRVVACILDRPDPCYTKYQKSVWPGQIDSDSFRIRRDNHLARSAVSSPLLGCSQSRPLLCSLANASFQLRVLLRHGDRNRCRCEAHQWNGWIAPTSTLEQKVAPTAVHRREGRHPEAAVVCRAHLVPLPYSSAVVLGKVASAGRKMGASRGSSLHRLNVPRKISGHRA